MSPLPFSLRTTEEDATPRQRGFTVSEAGEVLDAPTALPSDEQGISPGVLALISWGQSAAELCGVSVDDWKDAVRIILQTFGATPEILSELQTPGMFWQTLEKIGWNAPDKKDE